MKENFSEYAYKRAAAVKAVKHCIFCLSHETLKPVEFDKIMDRIAWLKIHYNL